MRLPPPCGFPQRTRRLTHLNFGAYHLGLALISRTAPREPSQYFRSELMDKKKLETFKKRLETRQVDLRRTVSRTQADGRSAGEDTAQGIAAPAARSSTTQF